MCKVDLPQHRVASDFHFGHFNDGDYMKAVEQKILSENLSRVLYPNDATDAGREALLEGRRRRVEAFTSLLAALPQRELAQLARGVAALERALAADR